MGEPSHPILKILDSKYSLMAPTKILDLFI